MVKRFLATLALVTLLGTSVLPAYAVTTGTEGDNTATSSSVVTNLTASKTTFDPNTESTTFSFSLNQNADLWVYVKPVNSGIVYTWADTVPYTANTQTFTWNGRVGNIATGAVVAEGTYKFGVVSKNGPNQYLDADFVEVVVDYNEVPPSLFYKPDVENLTVSDNSINPDNNETTDIEFGVDENAYVTVQIRDGSSIRRTWNDYDADFKLEGTHTITWNGKDNNGQALEAKDYTVYVRAYNDQGSDFDTKTVTVTRNGITTPDVDVAYVSLDKSTFNPNAGEKTQYTFKLESDNNSAYVTVEVKNSAGTVVKTYSQFDGTQTYVNQNITAEWDGKNNSGAVVADGAYSFNVKGENSTKSQSDSITQNVTVNTTVTPVDGIIADVELDPSDNWDPTADDELEIDFEVTEHIDELEIYAKKDGKKVFIDDDTDVDEDDYQTTWEGTDDRDNYVEAGDWGIYFDADGTVYGPYIITVEYEVPVISDYFVTKDEIDTTLGEVVNVVFQLKAEGVVTVDLYDGNRKELTLVEEEEVGKKKWYAVEWDGLDDDGDEASEGTWKFKITAQHDEDSDIKDEKWVEFKVDEDTVSSKKSNATNDYTEPVVFDDRYDGTTTVSYCIDEDAEVFLAVYAGLNSTGSAKIELLDNVDQTAGCHTVSWDGTDENGKRLKDGVYSYKLITEANGSNKDTEKGRFVIGNSAEFEIDDPVIPPPPTTLCGNTYHDVSGATPELCKAITWATEAGIFSGYSDGSFRPYNYINRAETLKVIFKAFEGGATLLPANGSSLGFVDVDPNAWYMTYVRTAKFYGMLHGYINQTEARLNNTINRVEMLKFVLQASDAFTPWEIPGYESSYYADVNPNEPTHDWFFDYAGVAYNHGLYNDYYDASTGKRYLNPGQLVTRGEVALMLYRMYLGGLQ